MKFNRTAIAVSTALVASLFMTAPAQANVPNVTVTVNNVADNDANTIAGAAVVTVPADNKVGATDAVKFALSSVAAGTTISVRATGARLLTTLNDSSASSGSETVSVNVGTGNSAEFFAFTTSTDTASVVITVNANSSTYYLKGTAGPAYNVVLTTAANANTNATAQHTVKITDAFGNNVAGETPTLSVVGATVDSAMTASGSDGVARFSLKYGATAGQVGVNVSINATDVSGLAAAKKSDLKFITVTDLAAEVTSLKAEVVALQASLAKSIADAQKAIADLKAAQDSLAAARAEIAALKADYNRLAKRWNVRVPKAKVTLKK